MSGSNFYRKAKIYWSKIPATIDGVLGGFGHISEIDLEGSRQFIAKILSSNNPPDTKLALDCGAGIGRVTKNVLFQFFDKVDMVEQDEKFADAAISSIGTSSEKFGSVYRIGLQYFYPEKKYDAIWIQWVFGHLNDDDACAFLKRCRRALNPNGVIFLKENVTDDSSISHDEEDSSVTRPYELIKEILIEAQLKIIRMESQKDFPSDIYTVYMIAAAPVENVLETDEDTDEEDSEEKSEKETEEEDEEKDKETASSASTSEATEKESEDEVKKTKKLTL